MVAFAPSQRLAGLLAGTGRQLAKRGPGLGAAAVRVNLLMGALLGWFQLLRFWHLHGVDLQLYRFDAARAWAHGWQMYYGPPDRNVNPPLQGLMVSALLGVRSDVAFYIWTAINLLCLFVVWRLAGSGQRRQLVALLALYPVLYGLMLGQIVCVVAAVVTLAWWLSEHERGFTAGLVLSLATVKPQLVLLLPLVLLLSGRPREFVGFAVGAALIGALSIALVGPGGVAQMIANQHWVQGHPDDSQLVAGMMLWSWFPGVLGLALTVASGLLVLVVACRLRGAAAAPAYAAGILGSVLVATYLHPHDLVLWIPAWMLMQRSGAIPQALTIAGVFCSWVLAVGVPIVGVSALLVVAESGRPKPLLSEFSDRLYERYKRFRVGPKRMEDAH